MLSQRSATLARPVRVAQRSTLRMLASTLYRQQRFADRFGLYSRTLAATIPLHEAVQAFLRALPVSQQSMAKCALKRHLGRTTLDWEGIDTARYSRDEPNLQASVLEAQDRQRVRAAAHGCKELAIMECLFTCRRMEVAGLSWKDVDLSRGIVKIRRGKGGAASVTLLTEGAQAALAAWFAESGQPPDAAPVFPRPCGNAHVRAGGHYSPGGLGKVVQRLLLRAGLWHSGIGAAHRFRRTFATEFLRVNEKDLVGLQRLMRHAQISTTQRYIFFNPTDLSDRLARVRL